MLVVEIDRENYEYDIDALVKSFYPEEKVKVIIPESSEANRREYFQDVRIRAAIREEAAEAEVTVEGERFFFRPREGEAFKEGFKRFFYRVLAQVTGKQLPWGNLTGIRPAKIAYGLLEEGKSKREIVDYYREKYYVSVEKAQLAVDIAERERALLAGLGRGNLCASAREEQSDGGQSSAVSGKSCDYERGGTGSSRFRTSGYSLYIGIPFCPSTCLYCSFTSYPIGVYRKQLDAYLNCLIKEMEYVSECFRDRVLDCVYIGGGTPTTLEPEQLERLLTRLKELFDFDTVKEFTVEAGRADSITGEKLRVLHRHGVTRISVNPQTMKQETLDLIGRKASVEQVESAFALARQAGFDNINMDLILGLPGETEADVQHTIDRVVELGPDSLTVHSLAIKRASRLNQWIQENGVGMLRNTDETMAIAAEGARRLGLAPYYLYRQKSMSGNFENVGYARPDRLGLYNILIMEEVQTIVALGAGSISKRVYPDGRIERCENVKEVAQYIDRIGEMIERKRVLLSD